MTAIVTGATGFLGRRLAEILTDRGERVVALHRAGSAPHILGELAGRGVELVAISDGAHLADTVEEVLPDRVFHLATHYLKSHTGADVAPLIQANVVFGAELIDALLPGTVVISTMSYFQFENGEERPHSLYAATKQAFSEIASYYRDRKELDVREVILFDTFGPRDTREKLIPRIVASIDRGEPMSMGNSSQPIDLLFVDDVVEGLIAASRGHAFERTALRSRRTLTVAEIVAAFEQVSGRELTKAYDDSVPPNDLVDRVGRWPAPPGWVPATELEEGAALTWEARGSY